MSNRDGLWKPIEPDWLLQGMAEETLYLKRLREPELESSMTGTALVPHEAVNTSTGEILTLPVNYDAKEYLKNLSAQHQQQLMAAYDAACMALLGANDVQQEGGRSFKKKSAWRKLARHFGISVTTDPAASRIVHYPGGEWVAYAHATAIAPWGQRYDDVGACGSDEESGRREITYADAIATAQTRASNRATSNLIAMGEVSADEISQRRPSQSRQQQSSGGGRTAEDKAMPFGDSKGTRLGDLDSGTLVKARDWCMQKDATKWADFIAALETVLENRRIAEEAAGQSADDGSLPF